MTWFWRPEHLTPTGDADWLAREVFLGTAFTAKVREFDENPISCLELTPVKVVYDLDPDRARFDQVDGGEAHTFFHRRKFHISTNTLEPVPATEAAAEEAAGEAAGGAAGAGAEDAPATRRPAARKHTAAMRLTELEAKMESMQVENDKKDARVAVLEETQANQAVLIEKLMARMHMGGGVAAEGVGAAAVPGGVHQPAAHAQEAGGPAAGGGQKQKKGRARGGQSSAARKRGRN